MSAFYHILVVDDDERLRGLIKNYLIKQGFIVATASDGAEALKSLDYVDFDLMVLDVMMPGLDGFEVLAQLRQTSKLPVLLLTAMSETEQRIKGLWLKADDYLTKPFEPQELVLRIEAILRRSHNAPPQADFQSAEKIEFSGFHYYPKQGQLIDPKGEKLHLTSNELSLMGALIDHQGKAVPREALSKFANIHGGDRAVDVQIARLRIKIEQNPKQPRHICTVHGKGYIFRQ
ncbi:MAG: response regulator transcription factor [Alphaproteobacteria bacterium]